MFAFHGDPGGSENTVYAYPSRIIEIAFLLTTTQIVIAKVKSNAEYDTLAWQETTGAANSNPLNPMVGEKLERSNCGNPHGSAREALGHFPRAVEGMAGQRVYQGLAHKPYIPPSRKDKFVNQARQARQALSSVCFAILFTAEVQVLHNDTNK